MSKNNERTDLQTDTYWIGLTQKSYQLLLQSLTLLSASDLLILNALQINNLNSLGCLTPLSLTNSPVSGIRAPVTIISNMASSGSPVKTVTINPRGLAIKPSPRPEKLSFITIKNPMEKNKIFIS